jgi:hypothetical protein
VKVFFADKDKIVDAPFTDSVDINSGNYKIRITGNGIIVSDSSQRDESGFPVELCHLDIDLTKDK